VQPASLPTITVVALSQKRLGAHVLDPLYLKRIFQQAQRKSFHVTGRYNVGVTETLSLNNQTKRTELRYISITPPCSGGPALLRFFFVVSVVWRKLVPCYRPLSLRTKCLPIIHFHASDPAVLPSVRLTSDYVHIQLDTIKCVAETA
jgi:hypothetical protein